MMCPSRRRRPFLPDLERPGRSLSSIGICLRIDQQPADVLTIGPPGREGLLLRRLRLTRCVHDSYRGSGRQLAVGKGNALCQWPVAIRGVGATIESEGNAIHVRQILVLGQRSRQRRSQYGETGADSARGHTSAIRATNAGLGPGSYLTLWSSNGGQSSNC